MGYLIWNRPHFVDKILKTLGGDLLVDKDHRIGCDQQNRDIGDAGGRIVIL